MLVSDYFLTERQSVTASRGSLLCYIISEEFFNSNLSLKRLLSQLVELLKT